MPEPFFLKSFLYQSWSKDLYFLLLPHSRLRLCSSYSYTWRGSPRRDSPPTHTRRLLQPCAAPSAQDRTNTYPQRPPISPVRPPCPTSRPLGTLQNVVRSPLARSWNRSCHRLVCVTVLPVTSPNCCLTCLDLISDRHPPFLVLLSPCTPTLVPPTLPPRCSPLGPPPTLHFSVHPLLHSDFTTPAGSETGPSSTVHRVLVSLPTGPCPVLCPRTPDTGPRKEQDKSDVPSASLCRFNGVPVAGEQTRSGEGVPATRKSGDRSCTNRSMGVPTGSGTVQKRVSGDSHDKFQRREGWKAGPREPEEKDEIKSLKKRTK